MADIKILPHFACTDHNGKAISDKDILKAKTPFVLYFYPKDDTPGCTTQACDFRDNMANLTKAGVRIFGVSPDSESSHQAFIKKYNLNFLLLSDPNKELATAFSALKDGGGINRSTFVFDSAGHCLYQERGVTAQGHVAHLLDILKKHKAL